MAIHRKGEEDDGPRLTVLASSSVHLVAGHGGHVRSGSTVRYEGSVDFEKEAASWPSITKAEVLGDWSIRFDSIISHVERFAFTSMSQIDEIVEVVDILLLVHDDGIAGRRVDIMGIGKTVQISRNMHGQVSVSVGTRMASFHDTERDAIVDCVRFGILNDRLP